MNSKQFRSSQKGRLHLPAQVYLVYLLVCTFLLTGASFSRYISSANDSDGARVAAGVVTVSYDDAKTVKMERPADPNHQVETGSFSFRVSNGPSEVAIRYNLVVKLDEALPNGVTISLYKNSALNPICKFDDSGETQFTVSDAGIFQAGSSETDCYELVFVGDFETISEDCNRTVSISAQAEQID